MGKRCEDCEDYKLACDNWKATVAATEKAHEGDFKAGVWVGIVATVVVSVLAHLAIYGVNQYIRNVACGAVTTYATSASLDCKYGTDR